MALTWGVFARGIEIEVLAETRSWSELCHGWPRGTCRTQAAETTLTPFPTPSGVDMRADFGRGHTEPCRLRAYGGGAAFPFTSRQDGEAALGDLKTLICILCILGEVHTRETRSEGGRLCTSHKTPLQRSQLKQLPVSGRLATAYTSSRQANAHFRPPPPPSCGLGEGGTRR